MIRFVIGALAILVIFTWDTNHSYGYACEETPPKDKFLVLIRKSAKSSDAMPPNEQIPTNAARIDTHIVDRARRKIYRNKVPSNDRNPDPAIISNRQFSQDKQKTYSGRLPSNDQKVPVKPVVSNDRMVPSTPSVPTEPQSISSDDVNADTESREKTMNTTPEWQPPPTTKGSNAGDDLAAPAWFGEFALIVGCSVILGVVFLCIFFRCGTCIRQMFNRQEYPDTTDSYRLEERKSLTDQQKIETK